MNLKLAGSTMLDFTKLTGSELYLDENAENILSSAVKKYGADGIHLLDNGNYHYITRLFLKELRKEFDLLYADNHSDDQPPAFEGLKSCGSWVADTENELKELTGGIVWIDGRGNMHKKGTFSDERSLYISVDKDVFNKEIVETNWDQGELDMEIFMKKIEELTYGRIIAGVDICGGCVAKEGFFDSFELKQNEELDIRLIDYFTNLMKERRKING